MKITTPMIFIVLGKLLIDEMKIQTNEHATHTQTSLWKTRKYIFLNNISRRIFTVE